MSCSGRNDPSRDDPSRNLYRRGRSKQVGWPNPEWIPDSAPSDPDREESDGDQVEARIAQLAGMFRREIDARLDRRGRPVVQDDRGRFAKGDTSGATAERDVRTYLTAEASGLTLSQLVKQMGISSRGVASRRRRHGESIVNEGRERLKNEAAW